MNNRSKGIMKCVVIFVAALLLHFSVIAQSSISQLLTRLQNAQSDSARVGIYNEISAYYQYSNPDSTNYYLLNGLSRFSTENYKYGVAAMTSALGYQDGLHGRMELGRKRQTEALKIFEDINNKNGIGSAHNGLGVIEGKTGNYDAAVKHFMIALKAFESDSNTNGVINTYLKLGSVNEYNNDLDRALDYYNKALSLTRDTPITTSKIFLYNNIGIIYGRKGNLKTSLDFFQKALQNTDKPELASVRILSLMNTGIVYHEFGDDGKALKYYSEAQQMAKDKNLPEESARSIINIATITAKTNPEKAIAELKEALVIAKKIGHKSILEQIYNGLVDDYKKTGNYKEALSLMEEQRDLEDSLYSVETATEIANLESVYDLEQSNSSIKALKLDQQRNLLKRDIIIVIAFGLAIALVFISLYYRKTKRLNEKLSRRESELEKSNQVKDKLFSIIGHDLRGPIGNIPMMLKILDSETTTMNERKILLDSMSEHAYASLDTLDKLLYWGKSQIKGDGVSTEKFMVSEYIQNNIKLVKSSAEQKQITIVNKIDPAVMILGDPSHFDFIIRNLLSNAIKFTRTNGIVELSAANSTKQPGFTVFAIKDDGIGIEKEKLTNIFEPFSNSTVGTANEKGTGIGLILCKEFVLENGGDMSVESESGKGSTFNFTFKSA